MNYITRTLYAFMLGSFALFTGCSDDEKPKEQLKFEGVSLNLKNAKIYLASQSDYDGHLYRDYFITDGTYTNANGSDGWNYDDYEGATYIIAVELGAPVGEELTPGDFKQFGWFGEATETETLGYLYYFPNVEGNTYVEIYSDSEIEMSPIKVTGGFDDGESMTIKHDGDLMYYYYNGTNWVEEPAPAKLSVTAKVIDAREVNPPASAPISE
jgi:hypothetical protein